MTEQWPHCPNGCGELEVPSMGKVNCPDCEYEWDEDEPLDAEDDDRYQHGNLAKDAGETVKQRAEQYGVPEKNLTHIAHMWSSYLGINISPWQVAGMMIQLKLARIEDGTMKKDSVEDIAGYADAGWAAVKNIDDDTSSGMRYIK